MELNKFEKEALLRMANSKEEFSSENGPLNKEQMETVFTSLSDKGLVKLILTKGYTAGRLTEKGKMLLLENPRLRLDVPENKRWIISTAISVIALVVAAISLVLQM